MAAIQFVSFDPFALLADQRGLPLADAGALAWLGTMAQLYGVVADVHDARMHQALRQLETRIGCALDGVWARTRAPAGAWLCVAADPRAEPWLEAARAAGAELVCMPRRGVGDPLALAAAEARGELTLVSDLWQLADLVARRNGPPVRYVETVEPSSAEALAAAVHALRYDAGPAMLARPGCLGFEVARRGELGLTVSYDFRNQDALDRALPAAARRGAVQAIAAAGRARDRRDFCE